MKKFLMATDLSARSDRALARAVALAHEHDAHLTVTHVVDGDLPPILADNQQSAAESAIKQHLSTLAAGDAANITVDVAIGRPYREILERASQTGAELIVLGTHREDAFKDMFRGTTVERLIRTSDMPVLLVKNITERRYGRVMVGVDFSVYSKRALEFATDFVSDGEFHLVHAFDVPFKGFIRSDAARQEVSDEHRAQFQEMIDKEMAAFSNRVGDAGTTSATISHVMQEGEVRDVLHRQIIRLKPDLLVVGTHGRTGVANALLGSVAEDILSKPPCDVLAVKAW